ncbi:proteasome assembly chaperone family protein [Acidipropionibacterium virtanenii]|uniref:PAC2 family protein n=1 Tax=Acidipropionibacterium virtanenii TaxID=2057246 RepID=A0A344UU69_9ACTN|nr:PAC2 family protein [Acidipropionibacterium virtanenii]AXE38817.1 hypothetical protein JS278_01653 [Acidipropionibacterium virtanenii]
MAGQNIERPWVVIGYSGWNDAGGAASEATSRLIRHADATEWRVIDREDYYDFQNTRPVVSAMAGVELLTWPRTTVWRGRADGHRVVAVTGPEPNLRWRSYSRELLDILEPLNPAGIVVLGGMVADVPHTRELPVSGSTADPSTAIRLGIEDLEYSGPTGISGVLATLARERGFNAVGLWASVPEYAFEPPCPPAVKALLVRVEELTGLSVPQGDLDEGRQEWLAQADQLLADNDGLSEYVHSLEEQQDAALPEGVTGDVLAMEFQSYLRHRR